MKGSRGDVTVMYIWECFDSLELDYAINQLARKEDLRRINFP